MLTAIKKRKINPTENLSEEIYETRRESSEEALSAMREMQRISELNGNSEMTLEEINAEIYAARREREAREARRESAEKALKALKIMNALSELNGNSEMTLEEINAEIYAARREMEAEETRWAQ